jgi:putative holliday junction resolvase
MPELGADAAPMAGRVGNPSGLRTAEGVALAFDFGTRRIGVAVGSVTGATARPLCVIAAGARAGPSWDKIAALIDEWQPAVLVVGIPRYPDGKPSAMTARCERFARQLQGRFGRAVVRVDERYSSAVVGGAAAHDEEAAAVILKQWLDEGGHA